MSRVITVKSPLDGEEMTMDIHDKSQPLIDRVALLLLSGAKVCCDDFLCSEEEIEKVIKELMYDNLH